MTKPETPSPSQPRPPKPAKRREDQPRPEDELGGGDFCSIEEQPSTEDDKPLG